MIFDHFHGGKSKFFAIRLERATAAAVASVVYSTATVGREGDLLGRLNDIGGAGARLNIIYDVIAAAIGNLLRQVPASALNANINILNCCAGVAAAGSQLRRQVACVLCALIAKSTDSIVVCLLSLHWHLCVLHRLGHWLLKLLVKLK